MGDGVMPSLRVKCLCLPQSLVSLRGRGKPEPCSPAGRAEGRLRSFLLESVTSRLWTQHPWCKESRMKKKKQVTSIRKRGDGCCERSQLREVKLIVTEARIILM